MREIKFRAWNNHYNTMDYNPVVSTYDAKVNDEFYFAESGQSWLTFMQYTGLKDKNGVEIYEGDIVSSETYEINKQEVKWFYTYWHPFEYYMSNIKEDFEVIGNIYENPELLNSVVKP